MFVRCFITKLFSIQGYYLYTNTYSDSEPNAEKGIKFITGLK